MKSSQRNGGFTLIELLVVIAIIAILAAMLFPVYAQAKMAAKKASSISQTKQVILASMMYLNDYDDRFHAIRQIIPQTPPKWAFGSQDMLHPYVKSWEIFKDPGDAIQHNDCDESFGHALSYSWTHHRSDDTNRVFGVHAYNHPTWTQAQMRTSLSQGEVGNPAATINMYPMWFGGSVSEGYAYYRWYTIEIGGKNTAGAAGLPVWPNAWSIAWCSNPAWSTTMSIGAFSGQVVWGFADGHVASMRRERVMDQTWDVTAGADANNIGKKNLLHYSDVYK